MKKLKENATEAKESKTPYLLENITYEFLNITVPKGEERIINESPKDTADMKWDPKEITGEELRCRNKKYNMRIYVLSLKKLFP